MIKIKPDWYKTFFKNSFYNPAGRAAVERALPEVRFILRKTKIKKGEAVLDLCCGPGRHSVVFAKKGFAVTGVDFSAEYLAQARERAAGEKLKIKFKKMDMRKLFFKGEFDLTVCLFTSFGYFKKESDDIKVLRGVFRALKPGGLFVLDFMNPDFLKKNYRRKNWQVLEDGSYLLEETFLDPGKKYCLNEWTRIKKGKAEKKSFFLRLYDKKRIALSLKKAGFRPLSFWGGFNGENFSPEHNRLIVLAKKNI